jgi:hypothetical protein
MKPGDFSLQPFSPRDLISSNPWSSILLTTYSLSLSFLEAVPLSAVYRSYKNLAMLHSWLLEQRSMVRHCLLPTSSPHP